MILEEHPQRKVTNNEQWINLRDEIRDQIRFLKEDDDLYFTISNSYDLPLHIAYLLIESIRRDKELYLEDLSSVSYYAVCRDILTPYKNKTWVFRKYFNLKYPYLKNTDERLQWFLAHEDGLTLTEKVALLEEETPYNSMGVGKTRFERVLSRINVNATEKEIERRRLQEYDGVWSAAIASFIDKERGDLTATEVLTLGEYLARDTRVTLKVHVMTSLIERMGKIEIYFLASQINKFHDAVSRTSSLLRAFAQVFDIDERMLQRLVSMHSMVDVASLVENDEILEQFEKILPFRTFKPMLAAKWSKEYGYNFPVTAEAKYDGVRLLVHKLGNRVSCYSRRRKNYMYKYGAVDEFSTIIPAFSIILDGEITAQQWTPTGYRYLNVYELHEAIKNGLSNYRLIYVVFDILYLNGVELIEVPYKERKKLRQQLFKAMRGIQPIGIELREVETVEVYNKKGLIDVYNQYVQAGFEGAIIKDPNAPYELGKRSNKWLKLKPKETIDCTITGIVPIQGNTGMRVWGLRYAVRDDETGGYIDLGMIRGIDAAAGTRLAELIIAGGLINAQAGLVDLSSDLKAKSRFAQSKDTMGFEIIPDIVINIDSLGIVRNQGKKTFKLRNARFLHIREDKPVEDIASYYEVYNNYDL